ncbi:hypothetical protein C2G38_2231297 [Gigaspora rosea]|uniref:Uncharacterized protein n=1 Tax=Gigaspora rosea TaxID=44941 RepID=A0A397TWI2_9GLOM|nr:hypothetical protein C2G38_2231297 [Gigaspora rosea]
MLYGMIKQIEKIKNSGKNSSMHDQANQTINYQSHKQAIYTRIDYFFKNQNATISVALKLLHESNNYHEEFIKESKTYYDIGLKDPAFLKCFGISKDKSSENYILVMKYAHEGRLR